MDESSDNGAYIAMNRAPSGETGNGFPAIGPPPLPGSNRPHDTALPNTYINPHHHHHQHQPPPPKDRKQPGNGPVQLQQNPAYGRVGGASGAPPPPLPPKPVQKPAPRFVKAVPRPRAMQAMQAIPRSSVLQFQPRAVGVSAFNQQRPPGPPQQAQQQRHPGPPQQQQRPPGPPQQAQQQRPLGPPQQQQQQRPPGPPQQQQQRFPHPQQQQPFPHPPQQQQQHPPGHPQQAQQQRPPGPPQQAQQQRPPGPPARQDFVPISPPATTTASSDGVNYASDPKNLQTEVLDLRSQLRDKERDLSRCHLEITKSRKCLQEKKEEVEEKKQENERLQHDLDHLRRTAQPTGGGANGGGGSSGWGHQPQPHVAQNEAALQAEVNHYKMVVQDLNRQMEQFRFQQNTASAEAQELQRLREEVQWHRTERQRLEHAMGELRSSRDVLSAQVKTYQEDFQHEREDRERAHAKMDKMNDEIANLTQIVTMLGGNQEPQLNFNPP